MNVFSPISPSERIGRTAADRAARQAAGTFVAICDCPPLHATPEMIAWSVLRSYVRPHSADDEVAAIVRAIRVELDAIRGINR